MHSFSSLYNENTVISKEYPGPLYFDITGVDCISLQMYYCMCFVHKTDLGYFFLLSLLLI